jgi:hypothetical protein
MNITQIESNIETLINELDKQTFIYDFLAAYGTPNATIKKLQLGTLNLLKKSNLLEEGTTDILWKKKLYFKIIEGQDLHHFIDEIRKDETVSKQQPRFIIVTDFKTILAYDTKTSDSLDCDFVNLNKHFSFFLPLAGMEKAQHQVESIADVKAAEKMAKLYDEIRKDNHFDTTEEVHSLNVFLSRLLFCFFAEDTDIFSQSQFTHSISNHTQTDGNDLAEFLDRLFEVMNTPNNSRSKLAAYLDAFPYVNGGLFQDKHQAPTFTRRSRQLLLDCGELNWSAINPDIFGSMIQAVITPEHRGGLGMHYTSVPNIMKVIEPLFLNELKEAFENAKNEPKKLFDLLHRLSKLKIFDPACGSGNFLIIAYKELRLLEIQIILQLKELKKAALGFSPAQLELIPKQQLTLAAQYQVELFTRIEVTQFYGIELDDFAHEIAILALWLVQHQMNVQFKNIFGTANPTLPLKAGGNIVHGNATRLDWKIVCPNKEEDEIYILGNPPYLGYSVQNQSQKYDMDFVFAGFTDYKSLDYISCWFIKGKDFISNSKSKFAFVSTNSICQGEQVSLLWKKILSEEIEINFAHTSFKWNNNAKTNAGVSVIIVGLRKISNNHKYIFNGALRLKVENISPYLTNTNNVFVESRSKCLSILPSIGYGSSALDGGHLLFTDDEKNDFIIDWPESEKYFKKVIGSQELIKGISRWCLWINDSDLAEASNIRGVLNRMELVKQFRLSSKRHGTIVAAAKSHAFGEPRFSLGSTIIIPKVSSEGRDYLPIGYSQKEIVVMDKAFPIYNSEMFVFSILACKMHILWLKAVGGKLETRLSYSSSIVYNTFPFSNLSIEQKSLLEQTAFNILDEREKYSEKTLAQLYDPDKMPAGLREAHHQNDLAVERCYRLKPFESDEERLEYLFKLYEQMIVKEKEKGTLFEAKKKQKKND